MKSRNTYSKRGIAVLCIAALLCAESIPSLTMKARAEEERQETEELLNDAIDELLNPENKSENSNEPGGNNTLHTVNCKEETVYVITDAAGGVSDVIVSDWLKNADGSDLLNDVSILDGVENVKGNETFTVGTENTLIWQAQGHDIYYQGNTDAPLPISLHVTYYLDGREISPEDLSGKSGHIRIHFDYENLATYTSVVDGEEMTVYVPFTVVTGLILDTERFNNITVTNGKTISNSNQYLVLGVAFPGLKESLDADRTRLDDKLDEMKIDAEEINIPDYIEIEADVTNFRLIMTMSAVTPDALNQLGFTGINNTDGIKELQNDMDRLRDASAQLRDGTGKLNDGVQELYDGAGELYDGTATLTNGVNELRDGTRTLADGADTLKDGAGTLADGAVSLQQGITAYTDGAAQIADGLNTLNGGLSALSQVEQLAGGAKQLEQTLAAALGLSGLDEAQKMQTASQIISLLDQYGSQISRIAAALNAMDADASSSLDTLQNALNDTSLRTAYETAVTLTNSGTSRPPAKAPAASSGISVDEENESSDESDIVDADEGVIDDTENIGDGHDETENDDDDVNGGTSTGNEEQTEGSNDGTGDTGIADSESSDKINESITDGVPEESAVETDDEIQDGIESQDDEENIESDEMADALAALSAPRIVRLDTGSGSQYADQLSGLLQTCMAAYQDMESSQEQAAASGQSAGGHLQQAAAAAQSLAGGNTASAQTLVSEYNTAWDEYQSARRYERAALADIIKILGAYQKITAMQTWAYVFQLSSGIQKLNGALPALTDGVNQLAQGANTLVQNSPALLSGAGSLTAGARALANGSSELYNGVLELENGADELYDGSSKLRTGAGELLDGVRELADGVRTLNEGMIEFDEEGIEKLADAFDLDVTTLINRLNLIHEAGETYTTFTGVDERMDSTVKFIFRTDAIDDRQ